jgi:hypothetical protein
MLITDAADYAAVFGDGMSWTALELDPGGRIRVTGYDGDAPGDWTPTHCTTHSPAQADDMGALLCRMAARARGHR